MLWLVNDDSAVGERRIERSEGIGVDQERSAARMHSEEHQIRVWRCDFDGNRHESGVRRCEAEMVASWGRNEGENVMNREVEARSQC